MNFNRKTTWDERREAAFNRAIVDRCLVASALYNLLTAVQVGDETMLRTAEEEAVRALSIVGGPPSP